MAQAQIFNAEGSKAAAVGDRAGSSDDGAGKASTPLPDALSSVPALGEPASTLYTHVPFLTAVRVSVSLTSQHLPAGALATLLTLMSSA